MKLMKGDCVAGVDERESDASEGGVEDAFGWEGWTISTSSS